MLQQVCMNSSPWPDGPEDGVNVIDSSTADGCCAD